MLYAKINESGTVIQYPYSIHNLRKDNPNTSFPKTAMAEDHIRSDYGVVEVMSVGVPASETHNVTEGEPIKANGNWAQTWDQTPKTAEELNEQVRQARLAGYGSWETQLEFITENGLEAWQANVAEIKLRHPK
jgi:hypothetical protein